MSNPKIKNIWLNETSNCLEIRVDWSNDRHQVVKIDPPYEIDQVLDAIDSIRWLLMKEKNCKNI